MFDLPCNYGLCWVSTHLLINYNLKFVYYLSIICVLLTSFKEKALYRFCLKNKWLEACDWIYEGQSIIFIMYTIKNL